MSREEGSNIALVRRLYRAVDQGDLETFLDLSDSKIRIEDPDLPGAGEFQGRDQAREFLSQWLGSWDDYSVEIEGLRQAGERVVALTRHRGRGKGSRVPVELADAHVWTLRDGRVTPLRTYLDRAEALEAVGLRD